MTSRFQLRRRARPADALFLAAVVTAAIAFTGDQALAGSVACGDTITTDTTLDADLVDCPNNGIVIGANGVTLDLNGHTLGGDGEFVDPCPQNEFCDVGVVSEGHNRITVKGGRVTQFAFGVSVIGAKGAHLRQLTASRNIALGVGVFDTQDAHLRRLTASHNVDSGILFVNVTRSELRRSSVNANGLDTDQAGMGLFESHDVKVKRTSFSRNGDIGLISDAADDILIKKNTVADNPEAGLLLGGDANKIASNRIVRNGEGIGILGNDNAITRNHVFRSRAWGINLDGGDDNRIAHNKIRGAGRDGIIVGLPFAEHGKDNRVVANRVRDVGRDGVRVGQKFTDTLLKRNHTRGADDDGIDARRGSTTLTRNHARHNHDLGIDAVQRVINGGGNRASGNGDSRQCVNVRCQ